MALGRREYFLGKPKGKTVLLVTQDSAEAKAPGEHFSLL